MITLGPEDQQVLGRYLDDIARKFDILLADTAAGIGPSVIWFNQFVDHNIVVASPEPTSLTDSYALMKVLKTEHNLRKFQLVLNFVKNPDQGIKTFSTLSDAAKKFLGLDIEYLGSVFQDDSVANAIKRQRPLVLISPSCPASLSIRQLAKRILTLQ